MTSGPEPRPPTAEELEAIAAGGTVDAEVLAWLQAHGSERELLERARDAVDPERIDETATVAGDLTSIPRQPTLAEMHRLAEGEEVDPSVHRWLAEVDDGSVNAQIEQLRQDADLLGELAEVHRAHVPPGRSLREAPAPEGYDVIREIDRGAQGAVYLARQTAAKRLVALKVLLQGSFATERQLLRFEREVEVVASLKHPHIVTLYDSGTTSDGHAYLAMEFVDGVPLHQFGGPDPDGTARPPTRRALVDLLITICEAVGYAHQRGIIHRDLKPANILVDAEGHPHILDFGLAKAVGPDSLSESQYDMTAAGEFMGTFAYASPEQVSGDPDRIDTRTDVYALGVIAFERLLGERPGRVTGSIADMVRAILEEAPSPPRSIDPSIDPDLETILLRSLDKDPDRRYQSPFALAADLRHWRDGEAIEARRDDAWYVARKFLRRHWLPVSGGVLGVAILAIFAIFMTVLWERADHFNRTSDRMLVSATELLANLDPKNPSQPMSARTTVDVMQRWSSIINENLGEFPDLAASLNVDLADNFMSLNLLGDAERILNDALATYSVQGNADTVGGGMLLLAIGRLRFLQEDYERSLQHYRDAYALLRGSLGPIHIDTLEAQQGLGLLLARLGEVEASRRELELARVRLEAGLDGLTDPTLRNRWRAMLANVLNSLAFRSIATEPEWTLPLHRRALDLVSQDLEDPGGNDWRRASLLSSIGLAEVLLGDYTAGRRDLEESLRIKQALDADGRSIANSQFLLAQLALRESRLDEAGRLAGLALAERRKRVADNHSSVIDGHILLAEVMARQGRPDDARRILETELLPVLDEDRDLTIDRLRAVIHLHDGRRDDAAAVLRSAWAKAEARGIARQPLARQIAGDLADLLERDGVDDETVRLRRAALAPPLRSVASDGSS